MEVIEAETFQKEQKEDPVSVVRFALRFNAPNRFGDLDPDTVARLACQEYRNLSLEYDEKDATVKQLCHEIGALKNTMRKLETATGDITFAKQQLSVVQQELYVANKDYARAMNLVDRLERDVAFWRHKAEFGTDG